MTQEQIKAKAKEYFPNDEFKQQIVIDAINWATEELKKENAELKKENAELKKKCYKKAVKDYCELEKENVELKNKIRFMGEQIDNLKAIAKYDQLTKAKKIIKNLMVFAEMDDREYEKEYKEAEQFLSEVEK